MRPRTRYATAGLLAVGPFAWPFAAAPLVSDGSPEVKPQVVVSFQDDAIDESSGAVVRGERLFTVNDSGDGPSIYEVDLLSGETVGVTTYAAEDPEDVEALAAGPDGDLWVGDIGDNRRSRGSIRLYRVDAPPGGGDVEAAVYDLRYPDGPHDAEALLVHPETGRVLVVTKRFGFGGKVYQAPAQLVPGESHPLELVTRVPGVVTDGTFLGSGDRLLLRTYGWAAVYDYPGLEPVVDFDLPQQEQGEAVAEGGDGRVYLTSEGAGADVLLVDVPQPVPGAAEEAPSPPPAPDREPAPGAQPVRDPQPWMGLGPAGFVAAALGAGLVLLLLRVALPRIRRRR